MENNIERRSIESDLAEIRSVGNSRLVEGYGIVFNAESKPIQGRFTEIILPEAVDDVLNRSDVLALMNHDERRGVLARNINGIGSMKLTKDTKGVKYSFIAPNTALGDELVEGIRRGDISASSFSFAADPKDIHYENRSGALPIRYVHKISVLADMSPVYRPAYATTEVTLRSLDEFNNTQLEEERKRLEAEASVVIAPESVSVEEIREESKIDYSKYEQAIIKYENKDE